MAEPDAAADARIELALTMNTTPTIKITPTGPEVGVATARLLLEHALEQEKQNADGESPNVARTRAINAYTGASAPLPPPVGQIPTPTPVKARLAAVRRNRSTAKADVGLITDSQHRGD